MSNWSEIERRLDTDAAALFDMVTFSAVARKAGATVNHRDLDDPARPGFTFAGSIEFGPPSAERQALSQREGRSQPSVRFDAVVTAHDPGTWPWQPSRRDHLVAAGAAYEIADVVRDGSARRVLFVNRVKP